MRIAPIILSAMQILFFSISLAQAKPLWETGPGEAGLGEHLMISDLKLMQFYNDFVGVFTICGVDFSNLNGSGSIELFLNHESGAGINIGFSGTAAGLTYARTIYYDSNGSETTIESRDFSQNLVTGIFDFRLFFYDILSIDGTKYNTENPNEDKGQWLIRSQFELDGGNLTSFNEGPYQYIETAFPEPYGAFNGGASFGLKVAGWDSGFLRYENIFIHGDSSSLPLEGNFIQGYSTYPATPLVPEPATMFLLGSGLIGFVGFRKRFRKK